MLKPDFFNRDACVLARALLGKVIRRRYKNTWLACRIIETEAYYLHEKGSHSSLGYTQKRKAMFMPAGTIYMYYARGSDSLNISARGRGNAVLIKAGFPFFDQASAEKTLTLMQKLNPLKGSGERREKEKLCAGQTLLCRSLNLKVNDWDQKTFDPDVFYIEDVHERPSRIIQTTRLGIHPERDAHLMQRFIDYDFVKFCTRNPLTRRNAQEGRDYFIS
ncbi:MAG TPA: DNA-3-methyladenine glycosylase [Gammaproteobacteria bacterium]|nr:DNA-3-methyladenine glycosylase [Gammaproteobacteria bacterium]